MMQSSKTHLKESQKTKTENYKSEEFEISEMQLGEIRLTHLKGGKNNTGSKNVLQVLS